MTARGRHVPLLRKIPLGSHVRSIWCVLWAVGSILLKLISEGTRRLSRSANRVREAGWQGTIADKIQPAFTRRQIRRGLKGCGDIWQLSLEAGDGKRGSMSVFLEEGVNAWNDWRGNSYRRLDLNGPDLIEANFSNADLRGANLSNADLTGADLSGANLSGDLRWAGFVKRQISRRLTSVWQTSGRHPSLRLTLGRHPSLGHFSAKHT